MKDGIYPRCDKHNLNFVTGFCLKCEEEFRNSGRYQKFLEEELTRTIPTPKT